MPSNYERRCMSFEWSESLAHLINDEVMASYSSGEPSGQRDAIVNDNTFLNLANGCKTGIWLLHNYLEPAHEICQNEPTPEGSWWHAIVHRLEGDYWNSKYWYAKIGTHPVDSNIESRLKKLPESNLLSQLNRCWLPEEFVDLASSSEEQSAIRLVSLAEWTELFRYCWQNQI